MGARRNTQPQKPKKLLLREQMPVWLNQRFLGGVMLLTILGGTLGMGVWTLVQPGTLPIKRVQVAGEFHYLDQKDLYAAMGDLASGGFFNVDVHAVKIAAESLPWVDSASVRRIWPDTLRVEVTEQVPLARWEKTKVVNVRGEVFQPSLVGLPETLPEFVGPEGTAEKVAENYQKFSQHLATVGLAIGELRLTERRAWDLRLDNGLQLMLGRTATSERLDRFVVAYPQVLGEKVSQVKSVDLRYTNGFAVRWKETSTG